jgi:hypothetical protein
MLAELGGIRLAKFVVRWAVARKLGGQNVNVEHGGSGARERNGA